MNQSEQDQLNAAGVDWDTTLLDKTSPRGFQNEPEKKLSPLPCSLCSKYYFYSDCNTRRYCNDCLCVKLSELSSKVLYHTRKSCVVCNTKFVSQYYDMIMCCTCYNYGNTPP